MPENTGNLYMVRRVSDGMVVPLTCSETDLPAFLAHDYQLVDDSMSTLAPAKSPAMTQTTEDEPNASTDQPEAASTPAS